MSVALITHKKITTTLAKAKETRMVVEKLVTRARRAAALENREAFTPAARCLRSCATVQQYRCCSETSLRRLAPGPGAIRGW